ncbi:MAG: HAMP domain-containing sensor histidine kinase [Bdellovibrionota bacterium]|mgnify:FL=1
MDSLRLAAFCKRVPAWPQNEAELERINNELLALCEEPLVAIYVVGLGQTAWVSENGLQGESKISVSLASLAEDHNAIALMTDFLKRQISGFGTIPTEIKKMQLSDANSLQLKLPLVTNLSFFPVVGKIRGVLIREAPQFRTFAWIIIGSAKPLDSMKETAFSAIANRLAELAEIAQLDYALKLHGQFLSVASHELKTPLTSIYGLLQLQERMLRLKKEDTPESQLERQRSFLKTVIRQVERLNELINGLLDVSRIQNGRFMIEPAETDVAALMRETVTSRLNIIADEAGVRLNVDAPTSLLALVDPIRMEEVITNMVMNAIRFSPEGGIVWLKLRENGGSFRFSVRDQGPNVILEDRERIFLPFERVKRTGRLGGLGLGLFISRQIALLHGGNVSLVESVPGKGNVFEANFPTKGVHLISA